MDNLNEDRCVVGHLHNKVVDRVRAQLVDDNTATRLAELFTALSDPTRVRIISALSASELCVSELAATLDMSQSAISHQLRVLRQLQLVRRRRAGRTIYYSLDDEHVSTLFREGMNHVQHG
ncbi:MAG TPA: metalloregulator ArsR/SmtB family transcription factor [Anaerolineae bacterium]|nr:metalloregulator ArsR/SmtB family transcription factor [Anaerolineae bacterium]